MPDPFCQSRRSSRAREHHHPSSVTTSGTKNRGEFDLFGWRYYGFDDVVYERRTLLLGGPILMPLTGVVSLLGNRRRRVEAERLAMPQWRPLGPIHVVVTEERLLVWFEGEWSSVWLASVTGVRCHLDGTLDLYFEADPPFRFSGADCALLTQALTASGVCEQRAQPLLEAI